MTNPDAKGQRFIASANGEITFPEIARLIKDKMPDVSKKVSTKILPDWVLKFASMFNQQAKAGFLLLKINRNVGDEKAKKMLGWTPVATQEEAILAAMESMIKIGIIA